MKKLIFLLSLIAFSNFAFSQKSYTIGNETLELKTEAEGSLDLLWNTFDGNYRYFIKTEDNTITELKNTKGTDNKYKEEYKTVLADLTSLDVSNVNLTTYGLKSIIDKYNKTQDSDYTSSSNTSEIKLNLGVFGGLTNSPFNINNNNEKVALFGAELEAVSNNSNHSGFINVRHTTDNDAFKYSATQIALGYRYRFINKTNFNIYAQTKFATYTTAKATTTTVDPTDSSLVLEAEESSSGFDAPFIFGLGADINLGNGYITLVYDSIFSAFLDNEGNFPVDFAIGYKFKL